MALDTDVLNNGDLLAAWEQAHKALESAKAIEMQLRKDVSKRFFPKPQKGTQRIPLHNGWNLKLVHKLNYKLPNYAETKAALLKINALGNEGPFLAERLVKFSPELSVSEYNALNQSCAEGNGTAIAVAKIVNDMLTITDAAPTLELEAPKV